MTVAELVNEPSFLNWMGMACWGVCFFWMWRISKKQNALLKQLHDQTNRIEVLSRAEHDLIKEVHPRVEEIKENLAEVSASVKENGPTK